MSDFNINANKCDNLPFEKIRHLVFKDILGVHNKASNLAVKHELGELPLCLKELSLMFNYFLRLNSDKQQNGIKNEILIAARQEDDTLRNGSRNKFWQKHLHNLKRKMNLPSLSISKNVFRNTLAKSYKDNITKNVDNTTIADRLRTVSWSYSHSTVVVNPVYGIPT